MRPKIRKELSVLTSFLIVLLIAALGAFAYSLFGPAVTGKSGLAVLENPTVGLTEEEALREFGDKYVLYLLYSIDVDELHKTPLTEGTPKIEIQLGEQIYNSEVEDGTIVLKEGEIEDEDIKVITTKKEIIKMMRDLNYVEQSFREGRSEIVPIASKSTLLSKGYLKLYSNLAVEDI